MLSTLVELLGLASLTVGCALVATWLAFVVAGVVLIGLGYALGLPK